MSELPKLTVGFSALAERVANIEIPEFTLPIDVLISIQNPDQIKYSLPTSTFPIRVIESRERGVAKSRNVVVANAKTEYLVFADDDAVVIPRGVEEVVAYLDLHADCDLVLAMATDEHGKLRKSYATKETKLHRFNSAKAGTIEMVVRVDSIKKRNVKFDENFGAGSKNRVGDEYVLISDLLKSGGSGVFLPIAIASHPTSSSGHLSGDDDILMSRAKVFTRVFGFWAPIIRAAFYLRRKRKAFRLSEFLRFIRG
ncbi:MAG: glycosyltransferase family A protein [Actinomycetota bacterium]